MQLIKDTRLSGLFIVLAPSHMINEVRRKCKEVSVYKAKMNKYQVRKKYLVKKEQKEHKPNTVCVLKPTK